MAGIDHGQRGKKMVPAEVDLECQVKKWSVSGCGVKELHSHLTQFDYDNSGKLGLKD